MTEALYPPTNVRLEKALGQLCITWRDGRQSHIASNEVRRYCACSSCRARNLVGVELITESSEISFASLMGNSALQIGFADGHDRGIYPWPYLFAIAQGRAREYLDE